MMNFEVNGTNYFLTVLPSTGRLALFAPTRGGMARLHIASDGASVDLLRAQALQGSDEGNASLN